MKTMKKDALEAKKKSNILLHNGRSVDQDFLSCILFAVEDRLPSLSHNKKHSLKQICGEFWHELGNGEKRRAGWCMEHLVSMDKLPLVFAEARHEYPKYYKLK